MSRRSPSKNCPLDPCSLPLFFAAGGLRRIGPDPLSLCIVERSIFSALCETSRVGLERVGSISGQNIVSWLSDRRHLSADRPITRFSDCQDWPDFGRGGPAKALPPTHRSIRSVVRDHHLHEFNCWRLRDPVCPPTSVPAVKPDFVHEEPMPSQIVILPSHVLATIADHPPIRFRFAFGSLG